jgi:hypothetical protein
MVEIYVLISCGTLFTLWRDIHSCRYLVNGTLLSHSCGILLSHSCEHPCRTLVGQSFRTLEGHTCRTLVGQSFRTLVALLSYSCGKLLSILVALLGDTLVALFWKTLVALLCKTLVALLWDYPCSLSQWCTLVSTCEKIASNEGIPWSTSCHKQMRESVHNPTANVPSLTVESLYCIDALSWKESIWLTAPILYTVQ